MKNFNNFSVNFFDDYLILILELILSILIIGILVAIAIPLYTSYIEKAKISEASTLMSGVKSNVAEYYSIYGRLPTKAEQLPNIKTSGQYTSNISFENGVLTASLRHNDFSVSFRPALANNELPKAITYVCGYAAPPNHFIVQGENQTNIPSHYLSLTCR
jgi:type IV pilus assembly protein PilA